MEKETETKIIELFVSHFGLDKNSLDPSMEFEKDLNLSTLEIADFLVILENAFHIEIPEEESERFVALVDVINYVLDHGNFT